MHHRAPQALATAVKLVPELALEAALGMATQAPAIPAKLEQALEAALVMAPGIEAAPGTLELDLA